MKAPRSSFPLLSLNGWCAPFIYRPLPYLHSIDKDDQQEQEKDADVKIILLGDSAVGKSKLVERFLMKK